MAATSTYQSYLMKGDASTPPNYTKVCDITEFPNLGGEPEMIDVTTLSDAMRHFIKGVQNVGEGMAFTALYDSATYNTLQGYTGEQPYAVWFGADSSGPKGDKGKFSFKGELSVYVNGAGVNAARTMTITIAPTTDITFSAS